ncbi:MAG: cupin domain-containing protein [Flavobacteriales bacterium]|nr:cupin domain-containing protein [Flavobacteriales bacterium]
MIKLFTLLSLALICAGAFAQKVADLPSKSPSSEVENILVEQIATDSMCTSFIIWIRGGVKHHFHTSHTENIYILEGEGEMEFGEEVFQVKAGDYILVPRLKVHSVKATIPMKVLSIQAPMWTTDDRKFVAPIRRPHNE